MRRRVFLASGLAAAAGIAAWRFFFDGTDEDAIVAVVEKRLKYLRKDIAGVRAFARDMVARKVIASNRLHAILAAGPLYSKLALTDDNALDRSVHHGEERITTAYLLSSDFFLNGTDATREVHYLGFYDPIHPCSNPFARIGNA